MKTIFKRARAETPPFFKKLRNLGLGLTAIAAAILTAPVSMPAAVLTAAGYLAIAGSVASAVSQLAVEDSSK
jgi:hypothetical protein